MKILVIFKGMNSYGPRYWFLNCSEAGTKLNPMSFQVLDPRNGGVNFLFTLLLKSLDPML